MMKILFTRKMDFAHKQTLQQAGFEVLDYDFLTTQPLPSATDAILKEINQIKNLVFTSQNAVKIFFEVLNLQPQPQLAASFKLAASSHVVNIFSTSGATKDLIEKYNYTPTLSADSAKDLAALMLQKFDLSGGVHFINGNISLPHLPDILREKGILVKTITVYETIMTPLSISDSFDAVAFLSLSAAESFLLKNTLSYPTPVFTLGQTTADYVRKNTNATNIFVAEKPTIAALVHCSCEFIRNIK